VSPSLRRSIGRRPSSSRFEARSHCSIPSAVSESSRICLISTIAGPLSMGLQAKGIAKRPAPPSTRRTRRPIDAADKGQRLRFGLLANTFANIQDMTRHHRKAPEGTKRLTDLHQKAPDTTRSHSATPPSPNFKTGAAVDPAGRVRFPSASATRESGSRAPEIGGARGPHRSIRPVGD
jgi:hypothetical protein